MKFCCRARFSRKLADDLIPDAGLEVLLDGLQDLPSFVARVIADDGTQRHREVSTSARLAMAFLHKPQRQGCCCWGEKFPRCDVDV